VNLGRVFSITGIVTQVSRAVLPFDVELHNVEVQNVKVQNAKVQNVKVQNAKVQNVKVQNVDNVIKNANLV
jgi:hypothetical protein